MMVAQICFGALAVRLPSPVIAVTPRTYLQIITGDDKNLHFASIASRSAEFCVLDGFRAKHLGYISAPNSPAPVETDRRPESADLALFVAATAPSLLREGRPPTAYQEDAEDEPNSEG